LKTSIAGVLLFLAANKWAFSLSEEFSLRLQQGQLSRVMLTTLSAKAGTTKVKSSHRISRKFLEFYISLG